MNGQSFASAQRKFPEIYMKLWCPLALLRMRAGQYVLVVMGPHVYSWYQSLLRSMLNWSFFTLSGREKRHAMRPSGVQCTCSRHTERHDAQNAFTRTPHCALRLGLRGDAR